MAAEFKTGDVVQLKSGGPKMTVTGYSSTGGRAEVYCTWFAGAKSDGGFFPVDAVVKVPEEKLKK